MSAARLVRIRTHHDLGAAGSVGQIGVVRVARGRDPADVADERVAGHRDALPGRLKDRLPDDVVVLELHILVGRVPAEAEAPLAQPLGPTVVLSKLEPRHRVRAVVAH